MQTATEFHKMVNYIRFKTGKSTREITEILANNKELWKIFNKK